MDSITITPDAEGGSVETHTDTTTEAATTNVEVQTETPDNLDSGGNDDSLILGKFKSQDDLIKSYQELQKKLSEGNAPQENTPSTPEVPEVEIKETAVEQLTTDEMNKYADSFMKNDGNLTEADYAELGKKGLGKDVVDSFIAGEVAKQTQQVNSIHEMAGGPEAFSELISWAGENISDSNIDFFNNTIKTNPEIAVDWLKGAYEKANGSLRTVDGYVKPTANMKPATQGYTTQSELMKDLGSKEYKTDPSFQKMVEDKLAKTTAF